MNNFDQDELMLADLSTDYNADDIIDHINVNELIYSSCNNFAAWTNWRAACYLSTHLPACDNVLYISTDSFVKSSRCVIMPWVLLSTIDQESNVI